jgi:hypothetical protein
VKSTGFVCALLLLACVAPAGATGTTVELMLARARKQLQVQRHLGEPPCRQLAEHLLAHWDQVRLELEESTSITLRVSHDRYRFESTRPAPTVTAGVPEEWTEWTEEVKARDATRSGAGVWHTVQRRRVTAWHSH